MISYSTMMQSSDKQVIYIKTKVKTEYKIDFGRVRRNWEQGDPRAPRCRIPGGITSLMGIIRMSIIPLSTDVTVIL
jgi:hypothetical protein